MDDILKGGIRVFLKYRYPFGILIGVAVVFVGAFFLMVLNSWGILTMGQAWVAVIGGAILIGCLISGIIYNWFWK